MTYNRGWYFNKFLACESKQSTKNCDRSFQGLEAWKYPPWPRSEYTGPSMINKHKNCWYPHVKGGQQKDICKVIFWGCFAFSSTGLCQIILNGKNEGKPEFDFHIIFVSFTFFQEAFSVLFFFPVDKRSPPNSGPLFAVYTTTHYSSLSLRTRSTHNVVSGCIWNRMHEIGFARPNDCHLT